MAKQELAAARAGLARQRQLHAQGEPQRDLDEAQSNYDAKARDLARAMDRLEKSKR
jgi:hypothetical protein